MSKSSWKQPTRWLLPVIVSLYLILATLYAVFTPAWQAPDEPAHYNYIRYLAEQHRFPVLKLGDYPATYLEEIKSARFPPEMSVDPIRYEFHQPPLYYLLAVPVFQLFGGELLPLRLFSVVLGAFLLLVVHQTITVIAPRRPSLALGTTAFAAFVPMHLTFVASANNDALAELLLATILLVAVRYLKRADSPPERERDARLLVLLGITTGLGLVTKSSVYVAVPLVLLVIAMRSLWLSWEPSSIGSTFRSMLLFLLPAGAFGLPWWARNILVYGPGSLNLLGLGRHDQVVVGQLRTSAFVAEHGAGRLVVDFCVTTFRSFWGQFGWMGVLLDQRLYQALLILSILACVGFLTWAMGAWRRRGEFPRWQRAAGGLLAMSGLFTTASYVWYNTGFLQHQGRYLFPAMLPLGLAAALGWREALGQKHSISLAILVVFCAVVLRAVGLLSTWPLLMLSGLAGGLLIRRILPQRWDSIIQLCPFILLVPLDLASLFLFIVPQLAS